MFNYIYLWICYLFDYIWGQTCQHSLNNYCACQQILANVRIVRYLKWLITFIKMISKCQHSPATVKVSTFSAMRSYTLTFTFPTYIKENMSQKTLYYSSDNETNFKNENILPIPWQMSEDALGSQSHFISSLVMSNFLGC